jgi:hypothetical protein
MPNDTHRFDPEMQFAALQERVYGLGQQFLHFEETTNRGFQQVESAIATLSAEVRAGGKTQWQTIVTAVGVLVAILGALGTLAYLPIKNGMDAVTGDTRAMRDAIVPRSEHVERWRRTDEDLKRLEAELRRDADRSIPRGEHEAMWQSNERRIGNLERHLDELRTVAIETHSARDALAGLARRVERIELSERGARPSP